MAPGRRLSMMSTTRDSEIVEAPADVPCRRGKAKGLAVKHHKKMNNNQKPRVEFRQGLLKPVGMWAKEFTSEAVRIVRMNAPLAYRNWKKVEAKDKKDLRDCILESFDVDLHVPHVRRAVDRFIGQRLRSFRNMLYKHYKGIPDGKDKRQHPHEDVQQADWVGLCAYFESEKFKKLNAKNTESRKKQTVNHCCGSKPFETKRESFNQELARFCWGNRPHQHVFLPSEGISGGIAIIWDTEQIVVEETLQGVFALSLKCRHIDSDNYWVFSVVYGRNQPSERERCWLELNKVRQYWNLPWLMCGDFNVVLTVSERQGGYTSREERRSFREFIDSNQLIEFLREGPKFSYSNCQDIPILSCLDRYLATLDWCELFPGLVEEAESLCFSDHRLVCLRGEAADNHLKPFRFQMHWLEQEDLVEKMKQWWASFHDKGRPGFVFASKLKKLKICLKQWAKEVYGRFEERLVHWEEVLFNLELQEEEDGALQIEEQEMRLEAKKNIEKSLREEECFFASRVKKNFAVKGDRCTRYFHQLVNADKRRRSINSMRIEGRVEKDKSIIASHVVNFYTKLYKEPEENRPSVEDINLKVLPGNISESLERRFTRLEIKEALDQLERDKSPGPDGMPMGVYQACWDFWQDEIMCICEEFYENGYLDWRLNCTYISLIPKVDGIKEIGDFRPISLLSGIYKIIAKAMANRLKGCMSILVSDYQVAGIRGRQIHESSLVANELLEARMVMNKPEVVYKLDFKKAFDSVSWGFIDKVLTKMGFGSRWRGWLNTCWKTTHFSVLINGVPSGHFSSSRGLRQGDPLSPILFVLAVEVLTQIVLKVQDEMKISGFSMIENGEKVPILQYVDDTILFLDAEVETSIWLKRILWWFEALSGLHVNAHKSKIFFMNEVGGKSEILEKWGSIASEFLDVYLGMPLGVHYKRVGVWQDLIDKFRQRLAHWKKRYLSKGGRLVLIKSTLASLPVHMLSLFVIPKGVAMEIEKIMRGFLWGSTQLKKKLHLKNQDTQEEPGRISMYHHTRFNKKKGRWVCSEAEENYNAMNALQSVPAPANETPLTEDQVYNKVLGTRPGYVNGLGHGQDPLPTSALSEFEYVEESQRNALDAERRAEHAERRAQEAQMRIEELERAREESERRTAEKLLAMQTQMTNFLARFGNASFMDLLMGGN